MSTVENDTNDSSSVIPVTGSVIVRLLPHQMAAFRAEEPYVALITGLGGGKTWFGARWLLMRAFVHPGSLHLATGNSYRQLQDVVIPELQRACQEWGVSWRWRVSDSVLLLNQGHEVAEIRVRSTERSHVDKIRGAEYGSWWGDEIRGCSRYAAEVVFGRLRCRRVPQARYLWTSTPAGFDHIYERHVERQDRKYRLITASSRDNPFLPESYVRDLEASYDEALARQEIEADFVSLGSGQVYRAFDRRVHMRELTYNEFAPLILACDFNIDPMGWVIVQESGTEIQVIDELYLRNASIVDAVVKLAQKWGHHRTGWQVYGDATGIGRTAQTGRTHYAILREAMEVHRLGPAQFRQGGANPPVVDRVNAVNALLRNARGRARLFIDESCIELRKDFEQCVWEEGRAGIDKRTHPQRSHVSDALGYYLFAEHRPDAFRRDNLAVARIAGTL